MLEGFNSERDVLQERIKQFNAQSTAISKLVQSASKIVSESRLSQCPVCQHQYEKFEELQALIVSSNALDSIQKEFEISDCKISSEINVVESEMGEMRSEYRRLIYSLRDSSLQGLKKIESSIESLTSAIADFEESLNSVDLSLESLYRSTEYKSQKDFYKVSCLKLEGLKLDYDSTSKRIEELKSQVSELDLTHRNLRNNISSASEKLVEVESYGDRYKAIYDLFNQLGEANNYSKDDLTERLNSYIDEFQKKIDTTLLDFQEINIQLDGIEKNLSLEGYISSDYHKKQFEELSLEYDENRSYFDKHLNLYRLFNLDAPSDLLTFSKVVDSGLLKIKEVNDNILAFRNCLKDCELLRALADNALQYSVRINLETEFEQIDKSIVAFEELQHPLISDLHVVNSFIQKSANDFFKTDLINQIYSAIDPHPDFSEISFSCKLTGTDKGILNIFAIDPRGNGRVSPNLCFSAAQINVLSLSIFLARALTTVDNQGSSVDCIFIDDPIQSMDSINVLSLIDLLRNLVVRFGKQIIISTHDENFHELLKKKFLPICLIQSF